MKREVSCRTLEVFFAKLAAKKQPEECLAAGTGYPVSHLKNKKEQIDWPAFVRFMANAGSIWTEGELIALGGAFFRSPVVRSILLPARLLFGPRDVYRWVYTDPK